MWRARVGLGFKAEGEYVLLIGETNGHLGQSLYLRELHGVEIGAPPPVDLAAERRNGDYVRDLILAGHATACHDVSDGGLLVALAEMAMASGIGATIQTLPPDLPLHALWFGEDQGRYLITVSGLHLTELVMTARVAGCTSADARTDRRHAARGAGTGSYRGCRAQARQRRVAARLHGGMSRLAGLLILGPARWLRHARLAAIARAGSAPCRFQRRRLRSRSCQAASPPSSLSCDPGKTTRRDAEKLLGAPNETETDKTPCGGSCMRTTVVWTYFQVRNGKSNADSVTEPVTLTFDQAGVLQAVGGG